jgi:hypothetical protein
MSDDKQREYSSYLDQARANIGQELGGRFQNFGKTTIVTGSGGPAVPRLPEDNPFHHDPTGPEPSLGFSIADPPVVGEAFEVQASLESKRALFTHSPEAPLTDRPIEAPSPSDDLVAGPIQSEPLASSHSPAARAKGAVVRDDAKGSSDSKLRKL